MRKIFPGKFTFYPRTRSANQIANQPAHTPVTADPANTQRDLATHWANAARMMSA